jgi:hypothetical protein
MKKRLLVILVVSVILLGAFSFTNSITTHLYSSIGEGCIDRTCSYPGQECSNPWTVGECWCHNYGFLVCVEW